MVDPQADSSDHGELPIESEDLAGFRSANPRTLARVPIAVAITVQ